MPSIPQTDRVSEDIPQRFKPYYKWNAFNTIVIDEISDGGMGVLNLIISGMPSIL